MLKGFYDSMKKSMHKYNKTKEAASQAGITAMRDLKLSVHPSFVDELDNADQFLMEFKQAVSNYKPKQSCLEIGILKTREEDRMNTF